MQLTATSDHSVLPPLSTDHILALWSKTYNNEGKPDWSHIFPYYHDEIIFEDSIQKVTGKAAFIEMCGRLASRCRQLNMEIHSIVKDGNTVFMQWTMVMQFNKYPSTPLFGCTKLTIGPDNRIIHQRDYFDLWGDIFNGIPYFKKSYRKFLRKHFG